MKLTRMENNKAIIYCRVSTKEQVDEGNSLASQEKLCREYAYKNGFTIDKVFIEEGESAKNVNRTQLQKLLKYCSNKKNEIRAVIAYKLDRISRNTDDYSQIRIVLKRYNVEIKSTSETFENTPAGKFMENMIANVAQFDNDVRTERSIAGMREAMHEGRYVWRAPFGYTTKRIAGKINIEPNEKIEIVKNLFETIAQNNQPLDHIRKEFASKGLVTSKNKPITKSQFQRLIKNETYKGVIAKFGERHKGIYKTIISEALFDTVQLIKKHKRKKRMNYNFLRPEFPLRRFVLNGKGTKLTGAWSKGRTKKYAYYLFPNMSGSYSPQTLNEMFENFFNSFSITKTALSRLLSSVEENYLSSILEEQKSNDSIFKIIEDLNADKTTLIQKNLKGIISDEIYMQHLRFIEEQIIDTQKKLHSVAIDKKLLPELIQYAKDFLKSPGKVWANLDIQEKYDLQWFNFPNGIIYENDIFRTTKISCILKVKSLFSSVKYLIGNKEVSPLNHQNRYTKSLDIAKSSTYPPLEEELILDEAKAREFDWGLFFEELQKLKRISEGKGDKKYKSLNEMLEESSIELLDAV